MKTDKVLPHSPTFNNVPCCYLECLTKDNEEGSGVHWKSLDFLSRVAMVAGLMLFCHGEPSRVNVWPQWQQGCCVHYTGSAGPQ